MDDNPRAGGPLQSGHQLGRALVLAGVVSLVLLLGMFVTSLLRAPNGFYTWILAAVAGLVVVALAVNGRRRWSRAR